MNYKITLAYILFIPVLIIAISSCGERQKSAEELKVELQISEQKTPNIYLSVENTTMTAKQKLKREGGLFRNAEYEPDGYILGGQIKSTATLAKYKDVQIRVTYLSATDSEIKEDVVTVYDFFAPNSVKAFSFHVHPPSQIKTYRVNIINAIAEN